MTEASYFWENNATGDGTSGGYSQAKWVEWVRSIFTKTTNRGGVSPEYLNELVCAGTATPVTVATGAAIVYGFFYSNDASMNVAIATPSSLTRVDRIVLRANWTAQTVRVTRIAGTEGAGTPSMTQTPGTTWDVPLATVSITTSGVITVTDAREWLDVTGDGAVVAAKLASDAVTTAKILDANVTTAKILDANVTLAKLASDSVDDTKVGNRVPQFYRRQGGDASDWSVAGTTTYTPTTIRMQSGAVSLSVPAIGSGSSADALTFPVAFSANPLVLITLGAISGSAKPICWLNTVSTTGFWLERQSADANAGTAVFNWLAIGPE